MRQDLVTWFAQGCFSASIVAYDLEATTITNRSQYRPTNNESAQISTNDNYQQSQIYGITAMI